MSAARTLRNRLELGRRPARRMSGSSRIGSVHTLHVGAATFERYLHPTKGWRQIRVG